MGKLLSPVPLHVNTITSVMRHAWGNPHRLKITLAGQKGSNLFVADFGCMLDRDCALDSSPWIVGKYSVLLQMYNKRLCADEICFNRMEIWARMLNLPLGG